MAGGGGGGANEAEPYNNHIFFHVFFSKTSFNNKLNYGDINLERKVVVKHRALLS